MGKTVYIGCTCHCGDGIVAETSFIKNVYISFTAYMHHTAQNRLFAGLVGDLRALLQHRLLMEILVRREDLEALQDLLRNAEYDEDIFENEGRISITYDGGGFGYVINLYTAQPLWKILAGKRYLCYEYCVGRKERAKLLKQISKALRAGEATQINNDGVL